MLPHPHLQVSDRIDLDLSGADLTVNHVFWGQRLVDDINVCGAKRTNHDPTVEARVITGKGAICSFRLHPRGNKFTMSALNVFVQRRGEPGSHLEIGEL